MRDLASLSESYPRLAKEAVVTLFDLICGVFYPTFSTTTFSEFFSSSSSYESESDAPVTDFIFLIFFAEEEAKVLLSVTTMITCCATLCAPLLQIRISFIYFFFTVTLNLRFYSAKTIESSDMKSLRICGLSISLSGGKLSFERCSLYAVIMF